MKKSTLFVSALTMALLQACGGGGGDGGAGGSNTGNPPPSNTDNTPPPSASDEGSVSAPFAAVSGLSRYWTVSSLSRQPGGVLLAAKQAASGAIVSFTDSHGTTSLNGSSITKDIVGDANYAIGRWVKGTVASSADDAPDQLTGSDEDSFHYAVYNIPASFPSTGNYKCTLQSATTPTPFYRNSGASTGSVDGTVWLNFDSMGAHLSGAMTITVGSETVTASVPVLVPPTSPSSSGMFPGSLVDVADAGNGGYALIVSYYAAPLANGALYQGVARMSCSAVPPA